MFETGTLKAVATSNVTSTSQHELAMFPVQPSTHYWLWIGAFAGSATTTYRATACGNHFFD